MPLNVTFQDSRLFVTYSTQVQIQHVMKCALKTSMSLCHLVTINYCCKREHLRLEKSNNMDVDNNKINISVNKCKQDSRLKKIKRVQMHRMLVAVDVHRHK